MTCSWPCVCRVWHSITLKRGCKRGGGAWRARRKSRKATARSHEIIMLTLTKHNHTPHNTVATPPTPSNPRDYPRADSGLGSAWLFVVERRDHHLLLQAKIQHPIIITIISRPSAHTTPTLNTHREIERPSHARPLRRHRFCHGPKTEPGAASAQEASAVDGRRRSRSWRRRGASAHLPWLSQLGARVGRRHAGGVESW